MSYSKTGSNGSGYKLLESFNHNITTLYPSLVNLKTDYKYIKDISGVRVNAVASLSVNDNIVSKEEGQVQFNNNYLSGICILNLSRDVGEYLDQNKNVKIVLNLVKEYSIEELQNYLKMFSDYRTEDALSCIIDRKLSVSITKDLNLSGRKINELSSLEIEKLVSSLQNLCFNIISIGDYNVAQVTRGGALLDDFNEDLESNKVDGLYTIGEVLDVDGKCGGYNLSWAFTSALIVSKKILRNFQESIFIGDKK